MHFSLANVSICNLFLVVLVSVQLNISKAVNFLQENIISVANLAFENEGKIFFLLVTQSAAVERYSRTFPKCFTTACKTMCLVHIVGVRFTSFTLHQVNPAWRCPVLF